MIYDEKVNSFLNDIYTAIYNETDKFLPYNWQTSILGCFYIVRAFASSMQFWFITPKSDDYINYCFHVKNPLPAIYNLQDKFYDLHDFCKECGDDWKAATIILKRRGRLVSSKYDYKPIKTIDRLFLLDWKGKYFYN